jgi:hypothetical protein
MLCVTRLMESIGQKVKKPMILTVDNKGTVYLINNWSCTSRTSLMDARKLFLRELKDDNILRTIWGAGDENESDAMTKNLQG